MTERTRTRDKNNFVRIAPTSALLKLFSPWIDIEAFYKSLSGYKLLEYFAVKMTLRP